MSEQGWLLESRVSGSAVWFRVAACDQTKWDWTVDASKAVRFSRKQDAEAMLNFLRGVGFLDKTWQVTGHEWVS